MDIDDFYKRKQTNDKMEYAMNKMDLTPGKKAESKYESVDEAIPLQIRTERKNDKSIPRDNEPRSRNHWQIWE